MSDRKKLLPFYFGTLDDAERLRTEERLLSDPEALLDYLDLKRELEGAEAVPQAPSAALWRRLSAHLPESRRARYALALGVSVAAIAALILVLVSHPAPAPRSAPASASGILFDSGREQFDHANVL